MCRSLLISVAFGVLIAGPGSVAATTLAEAVGGALALAEQGPRVEALRREADAVRALAGSPVAEDPALRVKHLGDRLLQDGNATEWEALVDLPLWLPGQRAARTAVAGALETQASGLDRLLRWEMAGRVRQTMWDAAVAAGRARQAELALASARALEATVAKRTDAGESARLELLTAGQETLGREAEHTLAVAEARRTLDTYRRLTGAEGLPNPLVETVPQGPAGGLALPEDHPLLNDRMGLLASADAERQKVQGDRWGHPVVSLGGKRVQGEGSADAIDALQIEISVPFGLASHAAPARASAERAYTERLTDLHGARREAEQALAEAELERVGATEALAVAERRQAFAQDALRLMHRAFDLGESDLADLLRAEERAREASMDLELRRLEQGRALSRLNQALGVIPE
jgi:outer membrane protein TolC